MKNTKKLTAMYLAALLLLISAVVTLRSVALFNSFDYATMQFDGSITFKISAIIAAVAPIIFLSYIFLAPKSHKLAPDCAALEVFIPSGILSVAFIFMSANTFMNWITYTPKKLSGTALIVSYLPPLLTVLAILAAAFFFLNFMSLKRTSDSKAILGMCAIAFLAIYGSYLFFTKEIHPTNSPNKIIDQMAYFSAALFMLFETRIVLGRDMWKPYISFGLISAMFCAYSSLPALILYFARGEVISNSIIESVLTLTLFIYILSKILLTLRLPDDSCCKTAMAIEQMAARREEELVQKRLSAHAHDYNIMEENSTADDASSSDDAQDTEPNDGQISFELDGTES